MFLLVEYEPRPHFARRFVLTGNDRLLLPDDRAKLEAFKPLKDPHYVLVVGIDSAILLHKNLEWLFDPKDLGREVFVEKGFKPIGELSHLPIVSTCTA